jgi:shikimate dehydrogenase
LSPTLHNYWIKNNSINAIYEKRKLDESELDELILQIKQKKIDGVNVTVPFKKTIIPLLDELSIEAENTQSVNTLYLRDNKVMGHNTDIIGFQTSIKKSKYDISNKEIFILGAGGVVPSIIFALNKMKVSKIKISNRTIENAENVKKLFKNIEIIEWGEVPSFDMIINATSIGLKKEDYINLDFSLVSKNCFFYDVIYNPTETNFLKTGKKMGNITLNGKLMFIHQALSAFNIWHGVEPDVNEEVINLLG